MQILRHVFKPHRRRHDRYVVWGVGAVLLTLLLALLAAYVWFQRPAPGPADLLGLPRLSALPPSADLPAG